MRKIKHFYVVSLVCFILVMPMRIFSQDTQTDKKTERKQRPSYIQLSLGYDEARLRDYATSPLVYGGAARNIYVGYLRSDAKRETSFGVDYIKGNYNVKVNDETALSSVTTLGLYYTRLYLINPISTEKWNFKAGGQAILTNIFRLNPSLQNNQLGDDIFFTLMGSAKATLDVSRQSPTSGTFLWIFNYNRPARKRDLSFQLNMGIINSNYRNGYAYTNHSVIINDANLFDGYEFNFFDGFRMSTSLEYTTFCKNGNALRWAYTWEGYQTSSNINQLETVHHKLSFSLLFGL